LAIDFEGQDIRSTFGVWLFLIAKFEHDHFAFVVGAKRFEIHIVIIDFRVIRGIAARFDHLSERDSVIDQLQLSRCKRIRCSVLP
jgi:hypothetical protein